MVVLDVDGEANGGVPRVQRSESMILKIVILAFLMLLLLIPLAMISGIVTERRERASAVVEEVGSGWGKAQVIGPIALSLPYRETITDSQNHVTVWERTARFLPEDLHIEAQMTPDVRHRSIYDVNIYTAHIKLTGYFRRPDLSMVRGEQSSVLWDDAKLTLAVADRKGINPGVTLRWRGEPQELASFVVGGGGAFTTGLEAPAKDLRDVNANENLPFEITLDVKGTERLNLQPSGKTTVAHLTSPWPHPSFIGAFLPDARHIDEHGFDATWKLTSLSRGYPQAWRDQDMNEMQMSNALTSSALGVSLVTPVDPYQQTERSVKYGALFILLTFTTFVIVEVLQGVRVHPIQYLMVGAALCLFYLLLLSLSEHVRFVVAYTAAAAATIGVITMYTSNVLGGLVHGLMTGAGLSGLYAFLFVLLQLEDYALLAGSLALFLILAFLMFVTRRINWYELRRSPA